MSSLLIKDYPLLVSPKLAQEIGLNEAIFLQQLHFWLTPDPKGNYSPHYLEWEGETLAWIYNTYKEKTTKDGRKTGWVTNFPFWSVRTIKRIVSNLKARDLIIITDQFNDSPTNRTLWYTINYAKLNELDLEQDVHSVDGTVESDKVALSKGAQSGTLEGDKVSPSECQDGTVESDKVALSTGTKRHPQDNAILSPSRQGQNGTLMTKTTSETTSDITTEITSSSEEKEKRIKRIIEYLTTCHYKENYIDKKPATEMAKVFINAGLSLEQIKDKMERHIEALRPDDTIGWVVYCVCKEKLDPPKRATQQTTLNQDIPTFSEAAQAIVPRSIESLPPDPWRDALKELRDDPQVGHFHGDLFNCEVITENGRLIVQNIRPEPADWLNNRPAGELVARIIRHHFGEVEVVFKPTGVELS